MSVLSMQSPAVVPPAISIKHQTKNKVPSKAKKNISGEKAVGR